MKNLPKFSPEPSSLAAEEEAHRACRRYEQALRDNQEPSLDQVLSDIDPEHRPLALYELVKLDSEIRRQRGETPSRDDYRECEDFPQAASAVMTALDAAAQTHPEDPSAGNGEPAEGSLLAPVGTPEPGQDGSAPQMLGRYQILERLGQGGMGTVFKAFDSRLRRFVALKVPHFDCAGDASIRDRFRREALALAALHHDMIVAVHDVERDGEREYMTMALIEGEPLRRYIQEGRPLAEHHAAILIRALAKAMHYVHENGVIHRDLKPENVIMEDGRKPVIVDFGLARTPAAAAAKRGAPAKGLDRHVTRFGQIAGTPEYSSPEQLAGDFDAIGPQTDVYSLGVILYELLTGRLPSDAADAQPGFSQRADGAAYPPASEVNRQVHPSLSAVCDQAMQPDQQRRYESMAEFAAALKPYCLNPAGDTDPSGEQGPDLNAEMVLQEIARQATTQHSRKPKTKNKKSRPAEANEGAVRRQRAGVAALALAAVGAVVLALIAVDQLGDDRQQRAPARAMRDLPGRPIGRGTTSLKRNPSISRTNADGAGSARQGIPALKAADADEKVADQSSETPPPESTTKAAEAESTAKPPADSDAPPGWYSAARRILDRGGSIVWNQQVEGKGWRESSPRELPPQWNGEKTRVLSISLKKVPPYRNRRADLLRIVRRFGHTIRRLDLTGVKLDRKSVEIICERERLRQLILRDSGLKEFAWDEFAKGNLKSLKQLDIGGNKIDQRGVDRVLNGLEKASAPLAALGLGGANGIDQKQLRKIESFPSLIDLDLSDATIDPDAILRLGKLDNLTYLSLAGADFQDEQVRMLQNLPNLRLIDLRRTKLSDACRAELVSAARRMPDLETILLAGTRFSSAGVAALAEGLQQQPTSVRVEAGDRLTHGFRKGPRRALAKRHYGAGPPIERATTNGVAWLLKQQDPASGTWSLLDSVSDVASDESRIEATALALLVLQGRGVDGLSKGKANSALLRGYQGLGQLVQTSGEQGEPTPFARALFAAAVCDLHGMSGFRVKSNRNLPQERVVRQIIDHCTKLQASDGGWGESDQSNVLLTGWYVQALTSAEAAGMEVDRQVLKRAGAYLRSLWRKDLNRFIYDANDPDQYLLASHSSTANSLQLITRNSVPRARPMIQQQLEDTQNDPYFIYHGARVAMNCGGGVWEQWNSKVLTDQLVRRQVQQQSDKGSWPSASQQASCTLACGRFYATCMNLLALETYYRYIPPNAPESWSVLGGISGNL